MSVPRKIRCHVLAILDHGGRVYTLDLAPASPLPLFRPGQFLHLTVDAYDPAGFWPESRVFSIASSPRERHRLRLCYAVKGGYTTKMEETLKAGAEVWIKLPYGDFVIDDSRDSVLIAGGTGISAFTAFLETLEPATPQRVWLVYGARTAELFLFLEMLFSRLRLVPNFELLLFAETLAGGFGARLAELPRPATCLAGRISLDAVWPRVLSPAEKTFYLSGPPAMLKALGAGLKSRGVPPAAIRTDLWE